MIHFSNGRRVYCCTTCDELLPDPFLHCGHPYCIHHVPLDVAVVRAADAARKTLDALKTTTRPPKTTAGRESFTDWTRPVGDFWTQGRRALFARTLREYLHD